MPTDPTASEVTRDRELQERLGYGMLDVQTESGAGFEDVRRYSYVAEPQLNPKATALRLGPLLGRSFSEKEAVATWTEILQYQRQRADKTGEDLPIERAAREWDARHGPAFRRRWYLVRPESSPRRYITGGHEQGPGIGSRLVARRVPGLRPLLEAGFSLRDVLAAWVIARRVPKDKRHKRYILLVAKLTGWTLTVEEAVRVWDQVLRHQLRLSKWLGHEVSLERATVDYFRRLRLSGLDRSALWETGELLNPDSAEHVEEPEAPSTRSGAIFPS